MKRELSQVAEFHKRIDAPIATKPRLLPGTTSQATRLAAKLRQLIEESQRQNLANDLLMSRSLMSLEEMAEWLEAHAAEDLTAATDAWADRCYVLFGDAIATGLSAEVAFAAVHASNMTKQSQDSHTGKGIKGAQNVKPDLPGTSEDENLRGQPNVT